jgi:hypothetical protein
VLAAMDDVTGKAAETEGEFSAEIEECANYDEQATEKKKSAAEFAKRVH